LKAAYDNTEKVLCRESIVNTINTLLPNADIVMLELLGLGIGANYFAENIPNLKHLVLIEKIRKLYYEWCINKHDAFRSKYNIPNLGVYNCSLERFMSSRNFTNYKFNVFDLDLCKYYYEPDEQPRPLAPYHLLNKIFQNKMIANDGLLFTNFQVAGWGPNMAKSKGITPIIERSAIIDRLCAIGEGHSYDLDLVFDCRYKSTHNNVMHCFGFQVTEF
jgi:hypothetical protein